MNQPSSYNGLALTPPMGWNSWNFCGVDVDEKIIKEMTDALVSSGMKKAGYQYINIDDCWQGGRKKDGTILEDPKKFPSGIPALTAYIHSRGLKIGIYTCAGEYTCQKRSGSLGFEKKDALTFAKWEIDFVKADWCYAESLDPKKQYTLISSALLKTGRQIVFSICCWGRGEPWNWAPKISNMWRTTNDIHRNLWDGDKRTTWGSILDIVNSPDQNHAEAAGPGHFNDPDMLEIGNGGLNFEQAKSHFSLWAIMAAPLIAGNDLRHMSKETLKILTNKEVIAVNQDPLGIQGIKILDNEGLQIWKKRLNDGMAVALFNSTGKSIKMKISREELDINTRGKVKDLWGTKIDYGNDGLSVYVKPYDTILVKIWKN